MIPVEIGAWLEGHPSPPPLEFIRTSTLSRDCVEFSGQIEIRDIFVNSSLS